MLGSVVIANVLYNLYGDTTPPASVQTRLLTELYNATVKLQRQKAWWFSRADATYTSAVKTIDISALGVSIAEIYNVFATPTGGTKSELTRLSETIAEATTWEDGNPGYFVERFTDYENHFIDLYPTPIVSTAVEIVYRKLHVPASAADFAAWDSDTLDLFAPYLEALVTVRMANILENSAQAATFSNIAENELDNLNNQNYDFNRQGLKLRYNGL